MFSLLFKELTFIFYLLQLLDNRDSKSTKKVIKGSVKILEDLFAEQDTAIVQRRSGTKSRELYSKKSLVPIKYGLQKHFGKERKIYIVTGRDFKASSKILSAVLERPPSIDVDYVPPTAKVIRRRDLGSKSHPKDWRSPGLNSKYWV